MVRGIFHLSYCPVRVYLLPKLYVSQQELLAMRNQMSGQINVEVDSPAQVDLTQVMAEMREQYEATSAKNQAELEKWYQSKVGLDQGLDICMF